MTSIGGAFYPVCRNRACYIDLVFSICSLKIWPSLLMIGMLLGGQIHGQGPFRMDPVQEIPWLIASIGTAAGAYFLREQADPVSAIEVNQADPNAVPRLDRIALDRNYSRASNASDHLLTTTLIAPALLLAHRDVRSDWWIVGIMAIEALAISNAGTNLAKLSTGRYRPLVYNDEVPLSSKTNTQARFSLWSGHASGSATAAFFGAYVFSAYVESPGWRAAVWSLAAVLPAATAGLRVRGGKHFPTDVAAGYAFGALVGVLVPHAHRHSTHKRADGSTRGPDWTMTPTMNGGPGLRLVLQFY